jgi:hypothetical protein
MDPTIRAFARSSARVAHSTWMVAESIRGTAACEADLGHPCTYNIAMQRYSDRGPK